MDNWRKSGDVCLEDNLNTDCIVDCFLPQQNPRGWYEDLAGNTLKQSHKEVKTQDWTEEVEL